VGEWYSAIGKMQVRACAEAEALIKKLSDAIGPEGLIVDVVQPDRNAKFETYIEVELDAGDERGIGFAASLDALLQEFSPYVHEPARFVTTGGEETGEVWVGDARAVKIAVLKRLRKKLKRLQDMEDAMLEALQPQPGDKLLHYPGDGVKMEVEFVRFEDLEGTIKAFVRYLSGQTPVVKSVLPIRSRLTYPDGSQICAPGWPFMKGEKDGG